MTLTDEQKRRIIDEAKDTFLGNFYGHGRRWDLDAQYEAAQELAKLGMEDEDERAEWADALSRMAIEEVQEAEGEKFWQQ